MSQWWAPVSVTVPPLAVDACVGDVASDPGVDATLSEQADGRISGVRSHQRHHADTHVERLVEIGLGNPAE